MENQQTKPWYTSKTVWGGIGVLIMTITNQFGVDVDATTVSETLFNLANAIAATVTIFGRLVAKSRLTS